MDRPQRARKSTKNFESFFYPTLGKKRRKNDAKTPEREPQRKMRQRSKSPSTNSTPNRRLSRAPSPSQVKIVSSTTKQKQASPQVEKPKRTPPQAPLKKAAETQTSPKTKKSLQEILNELYTNPEYPTAFGGELKKFILSKDTISKHRQRRKIFKRRKIFVNGPYVGVQADTINYRNYVRYNSGYRYILGEFHNNFQMHQIKISGFK